MTLRTAKRLLGVKLYQSCRKKAGTNFDIWLNKDAAQLCTT